MQISRPTVCLAVGADAVFTVATAAIGVVTADAPPTTSTPTTSSAAAAIVLSRVSGEPNISITTRKARLNTIIVGIASAHAELARLRPLRAAIHRATG